MVFRISNSSELTAALSRLCENLDRLSIHDLGHRQHRLCGERSSKAQLPTDPQQDRVGPQVGQSGLRWKRREPLVARTHRRRCEIFYFVPWRLDLTTDKLDLKYPFYKLASSSTSSSTRSNPGNSKIPATRDITSSTAGSTGNGMRRKRLPRRFMHVGRSHPPKPFS